MRVLIVFQSNVGLQLLVKQGWQTGQGLGKQNQGNIRLTILILEPSIQLK